MKITYIGHACFFLEYQSGYSICLDPYSSGSVPGLADTDLVADKVMCSHSHFDHNDADSVKAPARQYTGSKPEIELIHTYHDEVQGAKRGDNDITVIDFEGSKTVHLGDIGCDITDEQLAKIKNCDVLMIPVGGFYTIDCKQAFALCGKICPKAVIPMHYSSDSFGYDEISGREEFVTLINDSGSRKVIEAGSSYSVDADEKVLVLMEPVRKI